MIEESVQKNSVVESLKNHDEKIEILLRIDDDIPLEGRLFYLLMRERISKQEVYLPLKHLVENQFKIEIHEDSFSNQMEEGQTYNLYVTDFSEMTDSSESEDETEDSSYDSDGDDEEAELEEGDYQFLDEDDNPYYKHRLKLDVEMPELCFIENKNALLLAVPYRTDKGNASIKVKREMKITKTNQIALDETNLLTVSGYCGVISAEHSYRIKKIQILFKRDEVEHRFPVNYQQKSDIDGYRTDGEMPEVYPFNVEVPLGVLTYSTDERYIYRMYFEFICEVNGTEETLTTPSLVLGDRSNQLKGLVQIQKKNNVPIRYEVYRKKKRQTLGIRINDYTMKTRAKYYVKSKWKKFKKKIGKIKKSVIAL